VASHTGATRTESSNKPDFEAFISPLVLDRYGRYMHGHLKMADGTLREPDNWQRGIKASAYAKSLVRHVIQFWSTYRGFPAHDYDTGQRVLMEDILCAVIFNASGFLHELLKRRLKTRPR
jgi:hypothetical protein